ncbi:MAG TPA: 3-deoxy-7-phosphoheptulonate synthase, partial [bacterium]|nr:3-deoxy-7-phosphoheptulonate synthase [bacterium]
MKDSATEGMVHAVWEKLEKQGFQVHQVVGVNQTILGGIGDIRDVDIREYEVMEGVQEVLRITEPYKLASRTFHPDNTIVEVREASFGGEIVTVCAGPCSVESEEQLMECAYVVRKA